MDSLGDLTKLKVADLKKELKVRNLSQVGKRSELLERLQKGIASGVSAEEGNEDDEFDEDEILAGGDDEDDITAIDEEKVLAGIAPKVPATPGRLSRRSVAPATPATPRTMGRKLALKRAPVSALAVAEDETHKEATKTPIKAVTPAKTTTPHTKIATPVTKIATPISTKSPAAAPAEGEPAAKQAKLDSDDAAEEPLKEKTAQEKRAERFGIKSDDTLKATRADRFGIVTEDAQIKKREARFGVVDKDAAKGKKKNKMEAEPIDMDKLKSRGERFGTSTASAMDTEKKQTRLERFGNGTAEEEKKDLTSDEAKAARAAKFASNGSATTEEKSEDEEPSEPLLTATGKKLITFGTEDVSKLKRAARFAVAT